MKVTLTTNQVCPDCGVTAEVEIDGLISSVIVGASIRRLEEDGGSMSAPCGHSWNVEPKPKKLPWYKRIMKMMKRKEK